jgi:hypothetical protein
MTRRAMAAVSPPAHTIRATGPPAKQRTPVRTPRATVSCPLQTPHLRPSFGLLGRALSRRAIFGALSVDSRAMDPPATAPGRRQRGLAASAGRGRGGDLTPPTTLSRPARPVASMTESTTPRPFPLTKQPTPAKSRTWRTRMHEVDSRQPYSAHVACQAAGQHGHAESAPPGRASDLAAYRGGYPMRGGRAQQAAETVW